jgi:hypothetical protein
MDHNDVPFLSPDQSPACLHGRKIHIGLSSKLEGPVCFGLLHPTVLLPEKMYYEDSPQTLKMVLAHELAHIERRDGWATKADVLNCPRHTLASQDQILGQSRKAEILFLAI